MFYFSLWAIFWAVVGSFGTAYIHERTGRDVTMGGIFGLLVGAFTGIFGLLFFWIWLWYGGGGCGVGRRYGQVQNRYKRWYTWWN